MLNANGFPCAAYTDSTKLREYLDSYFSDELPTIVRFKDGKPYTGVVIGEIS